jgi:membrane protein implicated in regulation of membrane protease activity
MIKILGFILTILGAIALVIGVLSVFGSMSLNMSPWALIIIGIVFFFAGIGLLKHRKDTDQT